MFVLLNATEKRNCLAQENDRVQKGGAKNSHRIIDKLARYKGNNIRALATSGNAAYNAEHTHQWMDENGRIHRTAYLQARNIYEAALNIADGQD